MVRLPPLLLISALDTSLFLKICLYLSFGETLLYIYNKDTWACNSRFINFKISRWLGKKIQFIKLGKFWPHGSPLVCIQNHLDEWIYALITLIVNLELSIDNMRWNGKPNFWTSFQTWDDETDVKGLSLVFFFHLCPSLPWPHRLFLGANSQFFVQCFSSETFHSCYVSLAFRAWMRHFCLLSGSWWGNSL